MQKSNKIAALAAVMTLAMAGTSFAATGWVQEGGSWRYQTKDGYAEDEWKASGGHQFYLNEDGYMAADCLVEDGDHYYGLAKDGRRLENEWGFFEDDDDEEHWYWFGSNGRAKTDGFQTIDGKKYHFDEEGRMDEGWFVDGENTYFLNNTDEGTFGAAVTGWKYIDNFDDEDEVDFDEEGWYYFDSNGKMVRDKEKKIDGHYYAFNEDGLMCDYWVGFNGNDEEIFKFYRPGNGDRMDGWVYIEDVDGETSARSTEEGWYFLKNGRPYDTSFKTTVIADGVGAAKIDGKFYAFDDNGKMVTGKVTADDGTYYYFEEADNSSMGQMKTGKINIKESDDLDEDETYYFEDKSSISASKGKSFTGVKKDYLYNNGMLVKAEDGTKWQVKTVDGIDYLVNENGKIKKSGTAKDDDGVKWTVTKNGDGTYTITHD